MNGLFRLLLALWTIFFLVISGAPLLTGNAILGAAGLLTGAVLLVPWLVGVLVLSILIWLTNPRRQDNAGRDARAFTERILDTEGNPNGEGQP